MSSDNGIYILETKGPEYRVAHHQNIEEIYGNFSDNSFQWQGDPEMMLEYFGNAPMFTDEKKALDYAIELSYSYDYLEYGIVFVREFKDWDFNRLKERYGKEAEGDSR
jgi:hypothetical protein